jgi:hypothetical protein
MGVLKTITLASIGGATAYTVWRFAQAADEQSRNAGLGAGKRFVILGAGFGGMSAASEIAKLLPQADNGEITLID